ncbi:Fis family transcriptional regulator [candidate division GN15 bacterium]|uniref:Fis family transcriptional regulator n=1 Tax=candidate division GN15 bacterium TaxID=2072418 RepID=A0A855X3W4_9BACT|nr:MAG: Fis family transcriptional regulator [candidate division GN15 bacterium]
MPPSILVIDDEESMCNFMEIMLSKEGYSVRTTTEPGDGVAMLKEQNYDLVIADLNMPEMTGIEVLQQVRSFKKEQDLVVMTAYASVDTAIEAMKQGAADYITKPFKVDEIKLVIEKIISRRQLLAENSTLRRQLQGDNSFDKFIGSSEAVANLKKLAQRVARSDSTVLIRGESGTGKDLIAKAIHHHSTRGSGPFVTINCAALPETLLESELFGHKKGSFTGAFKDKEGLFLVANGGTFFLDEVGNTSQAIQVKLLRVLEDKKITPVGDTKPIEVDVRLIAATNADLEEEVKAGRFRADLFYRLNVIPIHIPPLRERTEDIPLLVDHFIAKLSARSGTAPRKITLAAMRLLMSHVWQGNVRELENTIERAILLNRSDTLDAADFPEKLSRPEPVQLVNAGNPSTPTLESIEKAYIQFVLAQTQGKKSEAARILGIDSSTLYRKIERYKLQEQAPSPDAGDQKKAAK